MRKARLLLALALLLVPFAARAGTSPQQLQTMFESYGDAADATQWSGADGTYSVPLPDGRVAWLFSDTFLGPVNADGSRPPNARFLHNSMVAQNGSILTTIVGPDASTLIVPPDHAGFYWMGDGLVENGELLVFVDRFVAAPIPYAFQQAGTDVARFSLPSLQLRGVTRMPFAFAPGRGAIPVSYGAAILKSGGYDYIFGVADPHIGKDLYVARVPTGHLLDRGWEYWAIDTWSAIPALASSIASGVANELSVSATGDHFTLVTQKNSIGKSIMLATASRPQGPWSAPRNVFDTPESNGSLITYNAKAHEELSPPGKLIVSYNVNSTVAGGVYANANNYRPRFVEISL